MIYCTLAIVIILVLVSISNTLSYKYSSVLNKVRSKSLRLDAYCLNVNLYIKQERRKEFIEIIKQNAQGSRTTEPKCKLYVWGESTSTPNLFHFQEIYDDKEGFQQHQSSAHFAKWAAFASSDPSPFTKPPEVMFFEEIN
jgi:quinol monooxygenase YgiN